MDDAKTHRNRIAFIFFTLALAIAAPWSALAQPAFSPATYTVNPLADPGGSSVTISGSEDTSPAGSTNITFVVSSIAYTSPDQPWLSVNGSCSATGSSAHLVTPATISLVASCNRSNLSNGSHSATVTLTDINHSSDTATISVTYIVGSGSGGTGIITASPATVTLSAVVGGTNYQTTTLYTTSNSPVSFSTSANPATWLNVSPSSGTVSASTPVTLGFFGNAAGYSSPTTLSTTIYVSYGTGSSVPISVNFIVGGGGTGSISLSQSTLSWSYVTSGSLPNNATIYINNSSAAYYGLSFSGSPQFLTANGASTNTSSAAFQYGFPITVAPIGGVISLLSTGTYYDYVTVTDTNGRTAQLTVVLTVNSGSSGITVSPDPITLSSTYLGNTVYATVTITSVTSGTLTAYLSGTTGLALSGGTAAITAGAPVYLTIYGTPGGISSGTYTGALNVTVSPTSGTASQISVPASFTITGGTTSNTGGTVAPSTLQFNYETGRSAPQPQYLTINGTTGGSDTFSISAASESWLVVGSSQGPAPATVEILTTNLSSLPVGTSTAYFTVTTTIGGYTTSTQITASILVTSSGVPVMVVQTNNGGSINLTYTAGAANPSGQALYLSASDGSALTFTAAATPSWITLSAASGTTPASVAVSLNASSLPNGLNSGSITLTGSFGTTTVPVVVYVTGSSTNSSGVLTLSTSSLTFPAVVNSTPPSSQTLSVTAASATGFTVSASGSSGSVTWLSVSPSGSLTASSSPTTITVSANQSGLSIGSYAGYISLVTSSGTQTVSVTLNVTAAGANTLTVSPTTPLAFSYTTGGATPSSQQVTVTSQGSNSVTFTIADSVTSGNWLILTTTTGNSIASGTAETTGFAFLVNANPTGLAAGTYTGTITLTPSGGSAVSISVTLTVSAGSTVSATPSTLSFSYQVGGNTPAAQSVSVTGAGNAALPFIATPTSTGNWLLVNGSAAATAVTNTPAMLSVTVAASSLTAGSYTGTIVVAGSGSAGGSTTITVTLAVTAPLPTITGVINAASGAAGKIAPGEIVSVYGTNLGPVNGLGLTLTSTGTVSTTLGNVSVTFGGYASPLVYVSNAQINCVVPYAVAPLVSPNVQVTYAGQTSNVFSLGAAATAPGLFTQNGQGSGPAAVLNASGSVNGPSNPATKGSVVVIFMTGEGQTSPAGVTGSVTAVTTLNGKPFTPQPLFIPAVTIGGQPATIQFYGEAPGEVAGVLQLNVVVPTTAASGADALVVSIGGNPSQSGVTVSVQ